MTEEQKKKTRRALREYNSMKSRAATDDQARRWCAAIEAALDYYDRRDPHRALLLRTRYIEGVSEAQTLERLYVSRTAYLRTELDALSTVAVFAAQAGCL